MLQRKDRILNSVAYPQSDIDIKALASDDVILLVYYNFRADNDFKYAIWDNFDDNP